MVVGEIPEYFQFPKRDICTSTARCKCTHYVFTYKGIKVVIRTEFINMTVLLCMKAFFNDFFFTWSWIQFFFKEIILVIRNFCIALSEIELVFRRAERQCSGSLFSMLLFKKLYLTQIFNQYLSIKRMIHVQMYVCMDTNIAAWIELSLGRCKRCHEHSMVNFVSMRDYLIPLICVYIPERVRA